MPTYPPVGSVVPFAGAVLPACWLWCDGSSYLRSAWPQLFAVIGTSWGSADLEHFNVPDLRGRVPVGVSPGGLPGRPSVRSLAGVGGQEDHELVAGEMPAHDHGGLTGETLHGVQGTLAVAAGGDTYNLAAVNHTHTIASAGGGLAHNTMQPFAVLGWIIKT